MSAQDGFDELSRRLERTDFSADSRARESLRARLLGRRPARRLSPARAAALALACAAALFVLVPSLKRPPVEERPGIPPSFLLPPIPPPAPVARRAPARKTRFPRGELGLPVLPGRLAETGAPEAPVVTSRAVDGVFDTRPVTLDDIFERREL